MRPRPHTNETLRLLTRYVKPIGGGLVIGPPDLRNPVAAHVHDLAAKITGASRAGAALAAKRRVAAARPDPRSLQTVGRALRRGLLRAAGGGAIVAWKLPGAAIHVWSVQVSGLGAPSVPKMRPVHWFAKSHGGGVAQLVRAAES